MKLFYTALMTKFNLGGDFYDDIGGRLYQGEAPEHVTYPYCVFQHLVNTQIDSFDKKVDDIVITFSIYSEKSSAVEVHDAMTDLKSLFDDCILTISGGTLVCLYRLHDGPLMRQEIEATTKSGIQKIWHYPVDYNAIFERN